ncbi:MAG: cytochrome C oxidase subunit IV family protein [Deltaproteobacteria bacterium]|nr:cytochrome C oxidase subunit IV family protein [Deltaproteobacteria bacterium]
MTEKFLVTIWAALLGLLGVSLVLGHLGNVFLATVLIFTIAIFKAWLVGAYYMRLKEEPRYILWILLGGVGLIVILYFTLVPDIIHVYGR